MTTKNTSSGELFFHKPVLIKEVLEYLNPQPGKIYLDVTFGSGGHTRAILEAEPTCKVIAMDWDTVSLETYVPILQREFGDRIIPVWGNFALLFKLLKKIKITRVDGILADFGTSQMHLQLRAGFSFNRDSPLDMRMSPPHQQKTAADVLNEFSEEALRELFWQLGEEKQARKIAAAIVQDRKEHPFKTTRDLAKLIEKIIPERGKIHPATRVFQALRIYVNKELDNIHSFLPVAVQALNNGGRLVCISFHSLEDRVVKQFFKQMEDEGKMKLITKKVVVPTEEEVAINPSSRSSKLRAAERTLLDH